MIRCLMALTVLFASFGTPARAQIFEEDEESAAAAVPYFDPDGEALRSILLPGWSQFRQGHDDAGLAYAAIAVVSGIFLFGVIDVPLVGDEGDNFGTALAGALYGLNAVVSGFDAHRRATESNRENGWDLQQTLHTGDRGWRLALVRARF